ncbi:hypothetical protein CCACVL1_04560 [Corchorus capsularis]|uniref:Uncharacterized protein n=1 Tax=Corchorus capsularis TaxID=210143 RepID=A0A1R3JRH7_COCAP|nr:hypothetical protein CCACVL1_04560 [Corchorus capsularis]
MDGAQKWKSSTSEATGGTGSLEGVTAGSGHFATIGANMELEFLMDSEIGRMLADQNNYHPTSGTGQPNQLPVNCGRLNPYKSCLDSRHNMPSPEENEEDREGERLMNGTSSVADGDGLGGELPALEERWSGARF